MRSASSSQVVGGPETDPACSISNAFTEWLEAAFRTAPTTVSGSGM